MFFRNFFNVVVLIFFFTLFGRDYSDAEEAVKEVEGFCPSLVAPVSQGTPPTESTSSTPYHRDPAFASFSRSRFYRPDPLQDGGSDESAMALPLLCSPEQDECTEMWKMRQNVAPLRRQNLRPWGQIAGDMELHHLERANMEGAKATIQVAEKWEIQKSPNPESKPGQGRQEGQGRTSYTRLRSSLELQTKPNGALNTIYSIIQWFRSSSSGPVTNFGQQASEQRSATVAPGDSKDHCRIHHQGHIQEHASSGEEG